MSMGDSKRDRISELPPHIRQHILSFLILRYNTKQVIATSLLSTTWRFDWLFDIDMQFSRFWSYRYYELCYKGGCCYSRNYRKSSYACIRYLDFLDHILMKKKNVQHDDHLTISKLPIHINLDSDSTPNISSFLAKHKVKELFLSIYVGNTNEIIPHDLLTFMLTTKVLTELELSFCSLPNTTFPSQLILSTHLRKLSLSLVQIIDEFVINNLIASCTFIESLIFLYCKGLKYLKLFGLSKLKELRLLGNNDLERVEIDKVPNFHSLNYEPGDSNSSLALSTVGTSKNQTLGHDKPRCVTLQLSYLKKLELYSCEILEQNALWMSCLEVLEIFSHEKKLHQLSVASCKSLTHLGLCSHRITDDWLNTNLSELVNLKVLLIKRCFGLKHIRISLKHLQNLSLIKCKRLESLEMECPNLSLFNYEAFKCDFPLIRGSIGAPTRAKMTCYNENVKLDHLKLLGLIDKLGTSKYLILENFAIEDMMLLIKMRQRSNSLPFYQVQSLTLSLEKTFRQPLLGVAVDALLWLFPRLKRIQLSAPYNYQLIKLGNRDKIIIQFTYKEPTELKGNYCGCYESLSVNCWRHSVKNFFIQEKQGFGSDDSVEKFFSSVITRNDVSITGFEHDA